MKPEFSAIPGDRLRIDQEDFKASDWTRTTVWGVPHLMSECYELVGGKWEGFVAIHKINRAPHKPYRASSQNF